MSGLFERTAFSFWSVVPNLLILTIFTRIVCGPFDSPAFIAMLGGIISLPLFAAATAPVESDRWFSKSNALYFASCVVAHALGCLIGQYLMASIAAL